MVFIITLINTKPQYKITIDNNNNAFIIEASGLFSNDIAQEFINEYARHVAAIDPSKFYLVINCKNLLPVPDNNYPYLKRVVKMYNEIKFKKRFCVVMNSTDLFSQLIQLDSTNFLRNIFFDSVDKIMDIIKQENATEQRT